MPSEYELHPTGVFEVEVQAHHWETTKKGYPMLVVEVASEHGLLWYRGVFTAKTVEHKVEDMRRMGFSGRSFRDCDDHCMVGNRFKVRVIHEEFRDAEGNLRTGAHIKSVFGERVRRESDSSAIDLASQWDALLAADGADAGCTGGDECPF